MTLLYFTVLGLMAGWDAWDNNFIIEGGRGNTRMHNFPLCSSHVHVLMRRTLSTSTSLPSFLLSQEQPIVSSVHKTLKVRG